MKTQTAVLCRIAVIATLISLSAGNALCEGKSAAKANAVPDRSKASFVEEFNGARVDESVWQIAGWPEHDGQTGSERCYVEDGCLNMLFINENGRFMSSAIQTWKTFLYGRWEVRLKCSNVPGVLNSFYTIDWGDGSGTKQEIDIEFLTKTFTGTDGKVHFAIHAAGKKSVETNPDIALGFDPSADFHVYAIDISPTAVQWLVDGQVKKTYSYAGGGPSITAPYQLKMNMWSQKGQWIGGPPKSGAVSKYLIDWIAFTPR